MVQTVDFFTPVVDRPYDFGQVAAANSLSDIYAMGGRPLTALNLAAFPVEELDGEILMEILRGGADKVKEAGAVIVGGHTIDDDVPKYGLAVTGIVRPGAHWTKGGARPGDVLYLTKPIGTGILVKATKDGLIQKAVEDALIGWMSLLNRGAAQAMADLAGIHAVTDVTGFGLLGHGLEMAVASSATLVFDAHKTPILHPSVLEHVRQGTLPGAARDNLAHVRGDLLVGAGVPEEMLLIHADPVTSGGLLVSVAGQDQAALERAFQNSEVSFWEIGRVEAFAGKHLRLEGGPAIWR